MFYTEEYDDMIDCEDDNYDDYDCSLHHEYDDYEQEEYLNNINNFYPMSSEGGSYGK